MSPPSEVWLTEPLALSASTARSTAGRSGLLANETVNSVPPAKSMPSRKWLCHIDTMPGMMISSDRAKNQLRLPMMFSFRTRGSRAVTTAACWAFPSSTMSATCCCGVRGSDNSDTIDSQQTGEPESGAAPPGWPQGAPDDDEREQAGQWVVQDHDQDDDRQAEQAGGEAELHRFGAQRRADLGHVERDQVYRQRT